MCLCLHRMQYNTQHLLRDTPPTGYQFMMLLPEVMLVLIALERGPPMAQDVGVQVGPRDLKRKRPGVRKRSLQVVDVQTLDHLRVKDVRGVGEGGVGVGGGETDATHQHGQHSPKEPTRPQIPWAA